MAIFNKSDKERIAKKHAKTEIRIGKLEDKHFNTCSDRKEKRLEKKIRKQKALQNSYSKILYSPTSTNKSTKIDVNINISKTHKTKKK